MTILKWEDSTTWMHFENLGVGNVNTHMTYCKKHICCMCSDEYEIVMTNAKGKGTIQKIQSERGERGQSGNAAGSQENCKFDFVVNAAPSLNGVMCLPLSHHVGSLQQHLSTAKCTGTQKWPAQWLVCKLVTLRGGVEFSQCSVGKLPGTACIWRVLTLCGCDWFRGRRDLLCKTAILVYFLASARVFTNSVALCIVWK